MLGIQTKQDKKLNYYKEQFEQIKEYYTNSKLKVEHKQRLDYFMNRAINYCKTQKAVVYEKIGRNYKHSTPYNKIQKCVYKKVLADVKELQNQIREDEELKIKHKQELCRCLSYVIGHLMGRLHSKFKEGYYARNK